MDPLVFHMRGLHISHVLRTHSTCVPHAVHVRSEDDLSALCMRALRLLLLHMSVRFPHVFRTHFVLGLPVTKNENVL